MATESTISSWFELVSKQQHEALTQFLASGYSYTGMSTAEAETVASFGANAVFTSWLVCLGLIGLALVGRLSMNNVFAKSGVEKYYADSRFSIRNFWEIYVTAIRNLGNSLMSKSNTKQFFWLFGGLFIYIFSSNIVGILPGGTPPSQDISNNLSMALVVLIAFTVIGLLRQGTGFIKHLFGPVWYLAWLIFPIELFSTFVVRPGSLALRLGGNMNGDHTVLGIAYQFLEYGLPVVALLLGTFVSLVQAFVFTLLTMIYVLLSLEHDDHH